jgi:signal peptidase I
MSVTEPNEDTASGETEEASMGAMILDQVVTLAIAIVIALAIRQFLVEPFRIPSGSMYPTLLVGDHLFVNKLAYGPSIPFTDLRLPGFSEPKRGDVVVFEVARPMSKSGHRMIQPIDRAPAGAPTEDFVKRLVGLPGDKITLRNGQVFINDELLKTTKNGEFFEDQGRFLTIAEEDLGDCRHAILDDPNANRLDRGTWVVEEGRYFMVGDNRDNSNDSRAWGTVRLEHFKGPAFILYWSWDVNGNMLSFFNPMNWFTAEKRWNRVFEPVRCEEVETVG